MSSAREAILGRIRQAVESQPMPREANYGSIVREYYQGPRLSDEERLQLFEERLRDYDAAVYRCREAEVASTVERALYSRAKRSVLIPKGLPQSWLPSSLEFHADNDLSYDDLDQSQGVLTGCALGIAVTGTIVLRHSNSDGRRALTLIPDYHLCVIRSHQVVETVVEGIRKMDEFGTAPLTTVSGPSATADIEMTRIKGVHGPRTLDVILVED